MPARDDKDDSQHDYESVAAMADRLKLKGKDRNRYIHEHMTGIGYRMVPSYVREEEDEDDGGGRFRLRGNGNRSRRSSRDDDDDDYPF
jgi:hypothetical protein